MLPGSPADRPGLCVTSSPAGAGSPADVGVLARRLGGAVLRHGLGWVLSVLLHLSVVLPVVAVGYFGAELDSPGEETDNDGPVGNNGGDLAAAGAPLQEPEHPVQVSVYKPPATPPTGTAPSSEPAPESAPTKQRSRSTTPPPPDAGGGGGTGAPEADGDAKKDGTMGKPPRGKRKPCEPIEEIVQLDTFKWRVERDMVDWYATHLRELEKQAGVAVHRNKKSGKRDGAKIYLPRCSILKQAGFRNGDIVRSVNGNEVYSIAQGIKVYLKLRKTKVVTVELTRKGEPRTHKYRLK